MDEKDLEALLSDLKSNDKRTSAQKRQSFADTQTTDAQSAVTKTYKEEAARVKESEQRIAEKERADRGYLDYTAQFAKGLALDSFAMAEDLASGIYTVMFDQADWHHYIPSVLKDDDVFGGQDNFHTKAFNVFRSPFRAIAAVSKFLDNTIGDGEHQMGNFISQNAKQIRAYKAQHYSDYGGERADFWLNGASSVLSSMIGGGGGMGLVAKGSKTIGAIAGISKTATAKTAGALTSMGMATGVSTSIGIGVYDKSLAFQLEKLPDYKAKRKAFQQDFIQKYMAENPGASEIELQTAVENNTLDFTDEYVEQNPEETLYAKKYAIQGAEVAASTNAVFGSVLNLGMGSIVANSISKPFQVQSTRAFSQKMGKEGIVKAKKSIFERTPVVVGREMFFEGIEEGGTEYLSEKRGELAGMGEAYGISDAIKHMNVNEAKWQFFWGALGGGFSTGVFKAFDFEGRKIDKERLEAAKKNIDELNLIIESADGLNIDETTFLNLSYREQAKEVRKAKILKQVGKDKEADAILNKIVDNQAYNAFQTGTTEKLIDTYKYIARDEKQSVQARKNAQNAIKQIQELEQVYQDIYNSKSLNKGAIFANRASKKSAERQINELDTQISKKKTELLADLAAKSGAGKMTSLDIKRKVTEDQGEGKMPIIKQVEETLDFDTNDLYKDTSKKFDNDESNKAYNEYKKQAEEFENAKQLSQLEKDKQESIGYISDLNDEYNTYKSSKYQNQINEYNEFVAGIRNKKDEIDEKMANSSQEEFDNYLDTLFKSKKSTHKYIQKERDDLKEGLQQRKFEFDTTTSSEKQAAINKKADDFRNKKNPNKEKVKEDKKDEITQENKNAVSETAQDVDSEKADIQSTVDEKENLKNEPIIIPGLGQLVDDSTSIDSIVEPTSETPTDPAVTQILEDNSAQQDASEKLEDVIDNPSVEGESEHEQLHSILKNANDKLSSVQEGKKESIDDIDRDELIFFAAKQLRGNLSSKQVQQLANMLVNYKSRVERDLGREATFEEILDHLISTTGEEKIKDLFEPIVDVWGSSNLKFEEDPYKIYERKFNSVESLAENFLAEIEISSEEKVDSGVNTRTKHENVKADNVDNISEDTTDFTMISPIVNEEVEPQLSFLSLKTEMVFDEEGMFVRREYVTPESLNSSDTVDNPHAVLDPEEYLPGTELTIELAPKQLHDKIVVSEYDVNGAIKWSGTFNEWLDKYGPIEEGSERYINKVPMIVRDKNGTSIAMIRDTQWIAPFNIKEGTTKKEKIRKGRVKNYNMRKAIWDNKTLNNKKTEVVITGKSAGVYNGARQKAEKIKEVSGRYPTLKEGAGIEKKKDKDGNTVEEVQTHVGYYTSEEKQKKCVFIVTNEKGERERVSLNASELKNDQFPIVARGNIIYNYEVRRVGTRIDDKGNKVPEYQAFAINVDPKLPLSKVGKNKSMVVFNLIYLNYLHRNAESNINNEHLSTEEKNKAKASKKHYDEQIDTLKNQIGFDIKDSMSNGGLISLLKQFITIKNVGDNFGKGKKITMTDVKNFAKDDSTYKDGDFFVYQIGSSLHYGIKRQTNTDSKANKIYEITDQGFINLSTGSRNVGKTITGSFYNLIKNDTVANMVHNVSHYSVSNSKKTLTAVKSNVVGETLNFDFTPSENTYEEGLYDILQTAVSHYNIGTNENPKVVTNIQPVITYEQKDKINDVKQKPVVEEAVEISNELNNLNAGIEEKKQQLEETKTTVKPATTEEEIKKEWEEELDANAHSIKTKVEEIEWLDTEDNRTYKVRVTYYRSGKKVVERYDEDGDLATKETLDENRELVYALGAYSSKDKPFNLKTTKSTPVTSGKADKINAKYQARIDALETQQTEETTAEVSDDYLSAANEIQEEIKELESKKAEVENKKAGSISAEDKANNRKITKENAELKNRKEEVIEKLNEENVSEEESVQLEKIVEEIDKKVDENDSKIVSETKKELKSEEEISQKDIDEAKKRIIQSTAFLDSVFKLGYPKVVDENTVQKISKKIFGIEGVNSQHITELTNFLHHRISSKLLEGEKLSKEEIIDIVEDELLNIISVKKDMLEADRDILSLAKDEQSKMLVEKIDRALEYLENIENNYDVIAEEGYNVAYRELGLTTIKEKNEEEENPEVNQNNTVEKNHSKTFLEEGGKSSLTYQLKRFFSEIPILDQSNNPTKGFLGVDKFYSYDEVFNTVQSILANSYPNFNEMIGRLEENVDAMPALQEVIDRLKGADKQIQNQFVSKMTKNNTGMQFISYSTASVSSGLGSVETTSLSIYDTNSANVSRKIRSNWYNNFFASDLIIQQDGNIYINPEKAEQLLNKYSSKEDDVKVQKRADIQVVVKGITSKNKKTYPVSSLPSGVVKGLGTGKNMVQVSEKTGVKNYIVQIKGDTLHITKQKETDRNYLNELKQGKFTPEGLEYFKEFLSNFGIYLSDKTIENLIKKGLYINKNSVVDFKNLFLEKGIDSEYIFGSLFSFLKQHSKRDKDGDYIKTEFDKEVNNPLQNSAFLALAKLESKYNEKGIMPTSFRDGKKTIQQYTIPKFMTDRVMELKNPNSKDFKNLKTCPFSENSYMLNLLANDPKVRENFEVNYVGINAIKERGKKLFRATGITSISDANHEIVKLGFFINQRLSSVKLQNYTTKDGVTFKTRLGQLLSPTMSDKSVATIITTPFFDFNHVSLIDGNSEIGIDTTVLSLLYDQLILPEVNRIKSFIENESKHNIKSYDKGAKKFLMLPLLNNIKTEGGVTILDLINNNISKNKDIDIHEYIKSEMLNADGGSLINEVLKDYVNNEVQQTLENWDSFGITGTDEKGNYVVKGIDTKFLNNKEKFGENADLKDKMEMLAYDFVMNNMMGNANTFMTIAGDPAMYYKSKSTDAVQQSKDTFNNIGKRLANQIAPREKLADAEDNQYLQLFLEDIEAPASNLLYLAKALEVEGFGQKEVDSLKKALAENDGDTIKALKNKFPQLAPYFQIEGTDAQEYTTWQEHLYVLEKLGETNPELFHDKLTSHDIENLRKVFEENIPLNELTDKEKSLIKLVMQPMKPVYTGQIYDPATKTMRVVYIKSSSIPLIPQLTKNLEIDTLRLAMEQIESKENKTVRASYSTANKVGATKNSTKLFDNSTGSYLKDAGKDEATTHEQLATRLFQNALTLDRKNFGIQQKVPFKSGKRKEDTVKIGTQTAKLILGDGITDIDGFLYDGKSVSGQQLKETFDNNFGKLTALTKRQLLDELSINIETGISDNPKKTAKALQKILKDEAESRGYSKQVIDFLGYNLIYDKAGNVVDYEFTIPLWMSSESNRFESLLNSIAANRIAKTKMPGNSYVASSQEGFKEVVKGRKGDPSKIIYTSSWTGELKGAEFDKDGNLKKTQVFLPSKFRTNDGKMLNMFAKDSEGKYIYVKQKEEGGPFMLNEEMFDKELLSNISFRTPTSAHLSMADVEIVGFVPYECGDLIVVPRNLTVQVGLDFDIDKQTNYQYYHEIDENGKVVVLKDNIEELEAKVKDTKQELKEGEFFEIEKEYEEILDEIHEKQKQRKEELRELKKDKKNSEEIINKLWQQQIDIDAEIDFITDQIKDLNKNSSNLLKEDVDAERKNLRKKRKLLRYEKEKAITQRKEISKNKVKSKVLDELQEQKNKEYKENTEIINEARKEKWDKIKKYKNELRLIISSGEKKLEKLYKNEIVKVHSSILSNKQVEVQKKIATALSIEDSKEQSDKLKSLKLNKDSKYDTFNPLTSNYQKGVMQAGAAGKVGIGAYSNDVVFHSLVRQNRTKDKRISLAEPITFGNLTSYGLLGEDYVLVENKKDAYLEIIAGMDESDNPLINNAREYLESPNEENVALGINFIEQTLFNEFSDDIQKRINIIKTPRKIADVLAERQNIATDNAKELIMEEAGLNSETLDVDKVMILLGFDKDASGNSLPFFFLNQPIVKDFIKELKNLDSVISEFIPDKQQHVYDLLKAKYKFEEKPAKIEALKNSQSKLMTGKNLEKQIKLFHTNGSVNENDFAFQQAVLEKFLDLRKTGKILRETQQNFNVDSQGIGKSTFDLYERIDRLKMLMGNKEVENIESLIGEFSESPKEGFIRLEADFYIKPTTALGHVTVNTLSTGLAVSEKHMPYNNVLFDNIFREIAAIKGGEMSPSAAKEMKQTVLQEMKKYINSSNFEFYDFNSRAERKYLFIDGKEANEKSLASYLQKSLLDPTGDNFAFLNSIPLFKQVDFEINKDGTPSKIKFNNTVDNIDENSLYTSIFKLMEKEIPLPSFNDREYNSRMLAQDLINYALLEGGVQEVTQISKFIPAAILENTKYSEIVNLINDGLISGDANLNIAKWFGIPKSTKKESSPYDISKFTMQYVQHNPGIVSLVDLKESNPELTNITVNKETKEILSFTYASEKQMPAFLKAYNSKANKNSDLYYTKDGENYYKIDTLGTSGMNEYNSETNRNVQDSILPKTSEISNADRFTVESQNDVFNEGKTPETGNESSERPFNLDKKDMVLSLKAIALDENIDPNLKFLAETLLPIAELDKNQVELIIMSLGDFENGAYYPEKNQLVIDSSFANSNKRNEIAEVLLHEYMHKLTVKELGNHVEIIGTTQPDIKINLKAGAPKHVENLVRLFNNFVKEAEKGIVIKKGKNKTKTVTLAQVKNKIRNGETLNSDERLLYPAIDIFEFMTGCTTNKDFQKLLYNTQYKGTGDSMFKKFKDIVKDFIQNVNLSLGLTKINDNNLSEALDNIFELIELPSKKKGTDIDESFFAGEKLKNDIDDALKKLEKAPGSVQNTQDDFENKELKFSYKSIHGNKTISIDTEFPLGAQQQKALENMIDWAIGGNDITYTLEGYAGTGKTSIIGLVEKYLKEYSSANGFAYMAPTHSATVSLGLNTSKYGNTTLPATFQSSVYQNARTGKHVFSMKMKERLESFYYPFVVVDEASMLSDAEVKQIIEAGKNANAKIIFVGDPKQVAAVDTRKGITQKSYSSAFSLPMKSILDKVYRTGEQKLLDILTKIRNNVNLKLYKSDQNTDELKFLNFSQYNRELEKDLKENPEDVSVLVYTNNEVISQNKRIRQVLNLKDSPKIGEKIMGYSGSENKKVEQGHLANSVPYTIEEINVLDTGEVRIRATGKSLEQLREGGVTGIPTSVSFDYLQLSTNDSFEFNLSEEQMAKNNVKISNIFKEVQAEYIKFKKNRSYYPTYIQNIREIKRSLAKYNLGNNYVYNPVTQKMELYSYGQHSRIPSVFQLKKGVDFGYAMTIHKSQGMTIPKVYFDPQTLEKVSNIDIVDDKGKATTTEKNSLYYVAMSRSSDKLVVMDSGGEEVIGKVAVDLDTVKEEFAKEQGFEDWKHVVRSINKRARERGKSEIPVSIEEFNNLTEKQISTFAKASKSAQQSKQPTTQPQETYKGLPVVDTENIISFEGAKGAAQYDRENNIVKVNRKFLQQKYKEKAWTKMRDLVEKIHGVEVKSKAQNLPANQFSTYKEFENFVIEHEYQHSLYSRQDFDKEFPGKTKGDYESEINRRALEELKLTKPVQPVVKPEGKKQPEELKLTKPVQPVVKPEGKKQPVVESFDINITGNYGEDGWYTYRSAGVEIKDLRYKADKAKGIFFEENIQNNKKVFTTFIDGSTKDHVKRSGAHSISLVFDENTSKTLDDVKQQLLDINKEISKFKGRRRVFKGKESIDNNAFKIGATTRILNTVLEVFSSKTKDIVCAPGLFT
jgi:hypothetical protein